MLYGTGRLRSYVNSTHSNVISMETKFDRILEDRSKIYTQLLLVQPRLITSTDTQSNDYAYV